MSAQTLGLFAHVLFGDAGKFDEVIFWQAGSYIVLPQLVLQVQRELEGKFKKHIHISSQIIYLQ
jgi:hypothetical protein